MKYLLLIASATQSPIRGSGLPNPSANGNEMQAIIQVALGILGAFALLVITLSGLRYITAGGSTEKTAKAKNGIVYALIGLIVAVSAEAIVTFVVKKL